MKVRGPILGFLVLVRLASLLFLLGGLPDVIDGHYVASDALRFHDIAVAQGTPYKDFDVEVPPVEYLALKAFHGSDARSTAVNLAWVQFAVDLLLVGGLVFGWGSRAAIAYLVVSLPLIPFLYFRLDLIPMALAVGGLALARKKAPVAGGIVLASAVLAKIWPVALLPVLAVERRWKALMIASIASLTGLAAWIAWAGLDGLRQVFTFRGSHGWQIESVVGTVLLLLSSKPVVYEGGALRVGEATAAARASLTATFAAAAGFAWWRAARRDSHGRVASPAGAPALTIVALMLIFSPILSWQYIAWMLPWAAIATADGDYSLGGLTLICSALTCWMIFQSLPLSERSHLAFGVVLTRDAFLIAIAVLGLARSVGREPIHEP